MLSIAYQAEPQRRRRNRNRKLRLQRRRYYRKNRNRIKKMQQRYRKRYQSQLKKTRNRRKRQNRKLLASTTMGVYHPGRDMVGVVHAVHSDGRVLLSFDNAPVVSSIASVLSKTVFLSSAGEDRFLGLVDYALGTVGSGWSSVSASPGSGGAGILLVSQGKVFLAQRSRSSSTEPGMWGVPGGKIDSDDASPYDAALREFEEECGTVPEGYVISEFETDPNEEGNTYTIFVVRVDADEAAHWEPSLNHESAVADWFTLSEALSIQDVYSAVRSFFEELRGHTVSRVAKRYLNWD